MRPIRLLVLLLAGLFAAHARAADSPADLYSRIIYIAGTNYSTTTQANGNVVRGPAVGYVATAYVLNPDSSYTQVYRLEWDYTRATGSWLPVVGGTWEYRRTDQFSGTLQLRPAGGGSEEKLDLSFGRTNSGGIAAFAPGMVLERTFWLGTRGPVFGPSETAAPLINVALRAAVNPSGTAIAGFVVGGTSPRAVFVRAVGPGLASFGVTSPLADPKFKVPALTTPLTGNDDWSSGPTTDVATTRRLETMLGAFPLAAGSKDAALLLTEVVPGAYTIVAESAQAGGSGEVLIEVYVLP